MGRRGTTLLWSSSVTGCSPKPRRARRANLGRSVAGHKTSATSVILDLYRVSYGPRWVAQAAARDALLALGLFHLFVTALEHTNLQGYRIKPHGQLVLVSCTHYCASTPSLSTSWSRTTLQGGLAPGIPNLQTSFPLRCLQRLSLPYIATRQCHWHDNRYTSGTSTPVLSY